MRAFVIATVFLLVLPWSSARAQPNPGLDAYRSGDYATAYRLFLPRADTGDRQAQVYLGLMYELGRGVEKNDAQAAKWYRAAADQGDVVAQNNLAIFYVQGRGVQKDLTEAVGLYTRSAEQGFPPAQSNLGQLYLEAGPLQDYQRAHQWLVKAADRNEPTALTALGGMYETGTGMSQDMALAARLYRHGAQLGDAQAQYRLGVMYLYGEGGLPKDDATAAQWLRKAADQDDADALAALSSLYWKGMGVPSDPGEAVRLVRRAAELGNPKAQYAMGALYLEGRGGVPLDDALAVEWFRKAADNGNAPAMSNLGQMYALGRGVEQNDAKAAEFFKKAIERGEPGGYYGLAILHQSGKGGVQKDDQAALQRLREAADKKDTDALRKLAIMHGTGDGVTENAIESAAYFQRAAELGDPVSQMFSGMNFALGNGVAQDNVQALAWYMVALSKLTGRDRELTLGVREQILTKMTPNEITEASRRAQAIQEKIKG